MRPTVCRCPAGCEQSRSGRVRAVPVKLARRTARSWRAIRDSLQRARPGPSPRSNRTAFDGDLVEQCSAYACPVHAYARSPRLEADPCPSACNRSSPATSRRVHPAYACVRSVDRGARKSPEKLGSSTRPPARTRWSQRCAYARVREEPDELVAGVTPVRGLLGPQTVQRCWQTSRAYAAARAYVYSIAAGQRSGPEKLDLPRPSG